MIYVKSVLTGAALLIGCVALVTFALDVIYVDLRAIIGYFPMTSLSIMLVIFAGGFTWQLRRGQRKKS